MDMGISLSEAAAVHIAKAIEKRGVGVGLRLGIKQVGCSGLAYTFDFADQIEADDLVFHDHGAAVVVKRETLNYMDGARLDFVREGLKETFRVENPKAVAACGCGESFTVA